MNRRGFLGIILATGVAPGIVRAESLMPWAPTSRSIVVPAMTDEQFWARVAEISAQSKAEGWTQLEWQLRFNACYQPWRAAFMTRRRAMA